MGQDSSFITPTFAVECLEIAGVMLLILNPRGEIAFINQRGCEILGGSREELLGRPWFERFVPEETRAHKHQAFQRILGGEPPSSDACGECWVFRVDGERRLLDFKHKLLERPMGEVYGVLSSGEDITERFKAEQALNKNNETLLKILDAIDVGLYVSDIKTHELLFVNKLFRDLHGDYQGKKCWAYLQAGQLGPCEFCNNDALLNEDGQPNGVVFWEFKNTSDHQWYELRDQAIEWHDRRMVRLEVATNIHQKKLNEQQDQETSAQIQYAQKLESLGVLAGGIAHDFNNLLMTILGNTGLAMCDIPSSSPARESLIEIESAAKRAAELCRQMLAYSGRGRFMIEAASLQLIVEEMTHLLKISISKKAVLKFNFAQNTPKISADVTQIRQIIMNLITNASEAIGDKSGLISLSTGVMDCDEAYLNGTYLHETLRSGMYAYIEVADTGCGMNEETKRRLFDPFFTTKFTGRGLGLSAVLGIVRAHHGAIKVYSEEQRGTTFKILFPVSEELRVSPREPHQGADSWRGEGVVLMVDDEESVRSIGRRMLKRMGFEVWTADDGQEAVRVFKSRGAQISGILMDLTMPHMDGEQAYREMRRVDPEVRVVLSSGYNEQEVTQRFIGKSLAGFIQKPYQYDDLLEVIKRAEFKR